MAEYSIPGYDGKTEKGHPLQAKTGSLTGWGITTFFNDEVRDITAPNRLTNKHYLDKCLERLRLLQAETKEKERQAYIRLGVKGLADLQRKIDSINNSGLIFLSNAALRKMPLVGKMAHRGPYTDEMVKMINNELVAWLQTDAAEGAKLRSVLDAHTEEKIVALFEEYLVGKICSSSRNIRPKSSFVTGVRRGKTGRFLGVTLDKKLLREYRKDIATTFDWHETDRGVDLSVEVDIGDFVGTKIEYYPYFPWQDFDQQEKQDLLNDERIWEIFKKNIASCCPAFSEEIKRMMDSMGVKSFATAATSQQDVVGILGELQSMVILRNLMRDQDIKLIPPRFLGHELRDGKKIGVDTALEGIGFQVKNYKGYHGKDGSSGIHLRGDYKLENFLDKLNVAFDQQQLDILEYYYAITVYHLIANPRFRKVYNRYKTIDNKLISLYHGAIDAFLPVQVISIPDKLEKQGRRDVQNLFYFIGGTKVVPVSKIIGLYILYLERLKEKIREAKLLNVTKHYEGQTYHDEYKADDGYQFIGYGKIADKTRLSYTINLNIDYTIKGMLSKIDSAAFEEF